MRIRHLVVASCVAGLLLFSVLASISLAAGTLFREAPLTVRGMVYDVNTDASGALFISDYDAREIWQVRPITNRYTRYPTLQPPSDAKPDSMGNIWWTDWRTTIGRINVLTNTVTAWTIGLGQLRGLALDDADRVWIAADSASDIGDALYRFDPGTAELCSYAWEGGSESEYILYADGHLWLADRDGPRIIRFDPMAAQDQVKWWSLAPGAWPKGLALDASGRLWWTDLGADALASLDADINRVTTYTLPLGSDPEMLVVDGGRVWYTTLSGTVGALDPALAGGTVTTATVGSLTTTSPPCRSIGIGATTIVPFTQGALAWGPPVEQAPVLDGDGWTIYQLPPGAEPWGIAQSFGSLWVADSGRQKLVRLGAWEPTQRFLPLIIR